MPPRLRLSLKKPRINTFTPHLNTAVSPLLRLPGELRNVIYTYALLPELSTITIAPGTKKTRLKSRVFGEGLLKTCQQLRREGWAFLLSVKIVRVVEISAVDVFFGSLVKGGGRRDGAGLGDDVLGSVKRLVIGLAVRTQVPAKKSEARNLLGWLGGLRYVRVETGRVFYSRMGGEAGSDWDALKEVKRWVGEKRAATEQGEEKLVLEWKCVSVGREMDRTMERRRECGELFGWAREAKDE